MDFELPEELKLLRDLVRRFVKKELLPLEDRVEEADDVPPDTLRRLRTEARELGLLGINIPEDCGGSGLGTLANCIVREELGRTSLAMSYTVRGPSPILSMGTPAPGLKVRWWAYPFPRAM